MATAGRQSVTGAEQDARSGGAGQGRRRAGGGAITRTQRGLPGPGSEVGQLVGQDGAEGRAGRPDRGHRELPAGVGRRPRAVRLAASEATGFATLAVTAPVGSVTAGGSRAGEHHQEGEPCPLVGTSGSRPERPGGQPAGDPGPVAPGVGGRVGPAGAVRGARRAVARPLRPPRGQRRPASRRPSRPSPTLGRRRRGTTDLTGHAGNLAADPGPARSGAGATGPRPATMRA